MKQVYILAGILATLPGAAFAQSAEKQPFNGAKIGVSVDRSTIDGDYVIPGLDIRLDQSKTGIGYRGHVGYDLQIGNSVVVGAEGGLGRGGRSLSTASSVADYTLKSGWNADVSGRIGLLPMPNVLVYGRGGYSFLRVEETTDFKDVKRLDIKTDGTQKGFLFGAGVEAAVASGLSARAEYNRANYGDGLKSSKMQVGLSLGF